MDTPRTNRTPRQEALKPGEFYGAVEGRREAGGVFLSKLRHSSARRLPEHAHERAFFCVVLGGRYSERSRLRSVTYPAGSVIFHPSRVSHQDEIGDEGARFFSIELCDALVQKLSACGGVPDSFCSPPGSDLAWLARRLQREYERADPLSALIAESLALELLARAARIRSPIEFRRPAWLSRVVEKIDEQFRESLILSDLARDAGVHPVHLSRVFRHYQREGIGDFVHRRRVEFAQSRLRDPQVRLCDLATDAGFSDQSHFTRVFKRITGETPARYRRSVLAGSGSRHSGSES